MLKFLSAGIPHRAKGKTIIESMKIIKELGLDGMEIEFVRNIFLKKDKAKELAAEAKRYGVSLTVHAPYYINLNAVERQKRAISRQRILNAAIIGNYAGAKSVTFHAGYFLKMQRESVLETVKDELKKITDELQKKNISIDIRPELTGKPVQVGSIDELIYFSKKNKLIKPCIDFSHFYAREIGKFNTYDAFAKLLIQLQEQLGKKVLKDMHIHISGIEYTDKGEKKHLNLKESKFNYKDLIKALKDFKVDGFVVCESPNLEEDCLLLKETFYK